MTIFTCDQCGRFFFSIELVNGLCPTCDLSQLQVTDDKDNYLDWDEELIEFWDDEDE